MAILADKEMELKRKKMKQKKKKWIITVGRRYLSDRMI
jgi:hypothetical protein